MRTLKNKTRPDTQIEFYKAVSVPTGLCGSVTWVVFAGDRSRLEAGEMLFL